MLKYKPVYDSNYLASQNPTTIQSIKFNLEKLIEALVPCYELEIKIFNNNSFISNKQRRVVYKCLKKKIFSWKGMWSDRELFYNKIYKLKLKALNHYTAYFTRPILVPIIDINYYLPKFSKFKNEQLFLDNNKNIDYKLSLDVNAILNNKCGYNESDLKLPSQLNNFIKDIYELNNSTIWKIYNEANQIDFNKDSEFYDIMYNKFKINKNEPGIKNFSNFFECCFVKQSHHIKGILYLNKDGITFRVYINQISGSNTFTLNNTSSNSDYDSNNQNQGTIEIVERDDDFDHDRNTCFGSYFVSHHKDQDVHAFNFPYSEIKYLFKRRYYHRKSAIEIFSTLNKSYYFNFKSQGIKEQVLKCILNNIESKREIKIDTKEGSKEDIVVGYEALPNKKSSRSDYLSNKVEAWASWKISNLEMLMWLNILANRSYSDLSQYPIFPWIIDNYKSEKIILPDDLRSFHLPMGMMELDEEGKGSERKELYLETFKSLKAEFKMNEDPIYIYGTHYSNPMYVSHYLTRIFPFAHIMIELQGDKFDDPNRLFLSVRNSFECSSTQKGDVRELIPEFFFLPEMFLNINNLDMGMRTDSQMNKIPVDNVELPLWANKSAYEFVGKLRTYLESDDVSEFLNEWIDLIFGYKQRGKEAEAANNLFIPSSYDDNVNIDSVERDQKPYYLRMVEFGLTPNQLLIKPINKRILKDYVKKGKQITESKELKAFGNASNNKSKIKEKHLMLKLKVLDNDKVICVYNNNSYNICKFTPNDHKYSIDIVTKIYNSQDNSFKLTNRIHDYYNESLVNAPLVIFNNGKVKIIEFILNFFIDICTRRLLERFYCFIL